MSKSFNQARGDKGYPEQVFDELVTRYEEPNDMTKWDSPLFNVFFEDERAPVDAIWEALINAKLKRPNAATLMKPATESNYLYELDKATQEIVSMILENQKLGGAGGSIPVGSQSIQLPPSVVALPALQRLRRQFININKTMMLGTPTRMKELFVEFLNSGWN